MYSRLAGILTPVANKKLGMTGIFDMILIINRLARRLKSMVASGLDKHRS